MKPAPQRSDPGAALALGGGHGDRPLTSRRLVGVTSTVLTPYTWLPRHPGEVCTPMYLVFTVQKHNDHDYPNARYTCREMFWPHDL